MFGVDDFDIIFIMLGLGLIIGAVVVAMFFSNHCKDKEPPEQVCKDGSDFQNRWYEKRWFWGFIVPGVFFLIMGIIASVQGWGSGTQKVYLEKYTNGVLNIQDKIKLNEVEQSFMELTLKLCNTNNTDLLNILTKLKTSIELYLKELISKNSTINDQVNNVIQEWSLEIDSEEIFNNIKHDYTYNVFIEDTIKYNEIMNAINIFKKSVNNDLDSDTNVKDTLLLLNMNCKDCNNSIESNINTLVKIINDLEPLYNYLLLDLSIIHKSDYMNNIENVDETFSQLINRNNNKDIPENIHIIFLNYIYVINYLKKEYHFLITTMKTMLIKLIVNDTSIDTLINKLNIKKDNINLDNIINNVYDKDSSSDESSDESDNEST